MTLYKLLQTLTNQTLSMQICYLYTNYPEERVPLPLVCDLIDQSEQAEPQRGSAITFVTCTESSIAYIGYLVFASGPDLCTLSTSPYSHMY